jgi:hypothetical protein
MVVGHQLSMPLEEINTCHLIEQQRRITQLGPGGIPTDSVTPESQALHPSSFGFLCAISGPECHSSDSEVYTKQGWVAWPKVNNNTLFACRINGRLDFHRAERLIVEPYSGDMIGAEARGINFLVTPNHRFWVSTDNTESRFHWETAEMIYRKARCFIASHEPYVGTYTDALFSIEQDARSRRNIPATSVDKWAHLVGWFIAEGWCTRNGIGIAQYWDAHPEKYAYLQEFLTSLGFGKWTKFSNNHGFSFGSCTLCDHFSILGKQDVRYIPEYLDEFPISARQNLLNALILGDGHEEHNGILKYFTISPRLADDVECLMISLGHVVSRGILPKEDGIIGTRVIHRNFDRHLISALLTKIKYLVKCNYFKTPYDGLVYCATVPGDMLFTRRGSGVGFWSGNSSAIGVDTRAAHGTRIGDDGKIYQKYLNRHTNKHQWLSPSDLIHSTVGLPD